jgi:hypothetical protein
MTLAIAESMRDYDGSRFASWISQFVKSSAEMVNANC